MPAGIVNSDNLDSSFETMSFALYPSNVFELMVIILSKSLRFITLNVEARTEVATALIGTSLI